MWASRALARLGAPAAALLLLLATTLQIQVSSGSSIVKRSLSALARTSQLPHSSSSEPGGHEQDHGGHPHTPGEPHKRSELQEEALREELLRQRAAPATEALLSAILEADPFENGVEDKRSLSSLARYGNLPVAVDDKRSLASLAREGNYPISLDDKRSLAALAREGNLPLQDDKRSLSSLARYGNLPLPAAAKRSLEALARGGLLNKNTRVDANKRSLSALARAGELPKRWRPPHQREQSEDLLDHLQRELEQTKRGLSSLARGASLPRAAAFEDALSLPISMEEQQGKRSLQSLARAWSLPEPKRSPPYGAFDDVEWVKRNAAALLRQSKLTGGDAADDGTRRNDLESERQGQGRRKRSLWDSEAGEVVSPYVQSSSSGQDPDWDGLPLWSPTAWGAYFGLGEDAVPQPAQQKRFLGRIPNMGRHRQKTNEDSSPRRRRPH